MKERTKDQGLVLLLHLLKPTDIDVKESTGDIICALPNCIAVIMMQMSEKL